LTLSLSTGAGNKSLFTSFSSEKEESSFLERKEAKELYLLAQAAT
jgi:hypothetical protein